MTVELILIGVLTVTSYRPIAAQTKKECTSRDSCRTSIDENVNELGCAVSQDLLASGKIRYRDVVFIDGVGYRTVFDTMHPRIHNAVDIFVYTKAEERKFGTRHLKVWVLPQPDKTEIARRNR